MGSEERIRALESQKGSAAARDAERMRQDLDRAKELSAAADPEDEAETSAIKSEQFKLQLKKIDRMIAAEGPDFKVAVKAFASCSIASCRQR